MNTKRTATTKTLVCTLFLVYTMLWGYAQAQERSTQSPEIQSFFLDPDLKGAGQNSVNLYSGDVNLPVNLLTIQGRGGLGANVAAFYNSNIQHQRDTWPLEAPTGILGLGWSMEYDRIVVDHKNSGTVHDDDFYLVSGGSSNPLVMTSSTGATNGTKTFETKNYRFWKITYYKSDERWEIVKEDGTTYIFGGGKATGPDGSNYTSTGNSIQWGVKWGNWIGSSMRTAGQQQHAISWNLSAVRNTWGDELTYSYLAVEEPVGRYGQPDRVEPKNHTKASYLQSITTPEGQNVTFIYGDKSTGEYTDPHQELAEPYGLVLSMTGPNTVNAGESKTWTSDVGNGSGALTYQWQYRYVGNGSTPWRTIGSSPSLTTSFHAFEGFVTVQLKLTVSDAAGKIKSITKNITVLGGPDGCEEPVIDPDGCDPDPVDEGGGGSGGSGGGGGGGTGGGGSGGGNDDCEQELVPVECGEHGDPIPLTFMATPAGDGVMVSGPAADDTLGGRNSVPHVHYEPDAYQENYETKYLNRIEVYAQTGAMRYYIDFGYSGYSTAGQPDYNRLLTSITHTWPHGKALPSLDFGYYGSADVHPAALKKVAWPTGAEVTYTYTEKTLTRSDQYVWVTTPEPTSPGGSGGGGGGGECEQELVPVECEFDGPEPLTFMDTLAREEQTVGDSTRSGTILPFSHGRNSPAPGDYEKPKVYHGTDYVVFTWRNSFDQLKIKLLHWVGEWREYEFGPIAHAGKLHSGDAINYSITLQDDFFAILNRAAEQSSTKTLYTYRKHGKTNSWISNTKTYSFAGSKAGITSGSHFIAVIDWEKGTTYRKRWTGASWEESTIPNTKYSDDHNYYMGGANNYYIEGNEGISGPDEFTVHYLDELKQWKATSPQTFNQLHSSTSNTSDFNSIHVSSSIFGLSLVDDGEAVGRLNESYSMQDVIGTTGHNAYDPVHIVNNQSVTFSERDGDPNPDHYRFDGVSWIHKQISRRYFSLSPDVIIERTGDQTGRYLRFNPGSRLWETKQTLSDYSSGYSSPEAGIKHFTFGNKMYELLFNGSSNYMGTLQTYQAGDLVIDEQLRFGRNFVAYDVGTPDGSGYSHNGANVTILKNGSGQIGPFQLNGYVVDYEVGSLISANFISSNLGSNGFGLRYVSNEDIRGYLKDYPVTRVEVDDGYQVVSSVFEYTTSTATLDPSGTLARYNKVTTKAGNFDEGKTEHYFFNGLDNTRLDVDYPENSAYTNADTYRNQVQGLLYKTRAYTNNNVLVSETTHYHQVLEKQIRRSPGNTLIDRGYYVRKRRTETMLDGVTTYANTLYNSSNGLPRATETSNYNVDGDEEVHRTRVRYGFEQYAALTTRHILAPVIEHIAMVQPVGAGASATITSKQVSTWKDWGGGKWAPNRSYVWKGTGSSAFNYTTPGSNWLKTSEIISRNNYGTPTEVMDGDGIYATHVSGFNGTRPVASFANARAHEVAADGFDDISVLASSPLGWAQYQGGNWAIIDGELYASKTGGGQGFLQAVGKRFTHSGSVIEFDTKFESGGTNGWMGLQFRLANEEEGLSGGHYLKMTKGGSVAVVNSSGTTLGSGSVTGSTKTWRHVRLVSYSNGDINLFVDGEHLISANSTSGMNNRFYGFIIKGAAVRIDNFRIYPNDAVAQSTGYDPEYGLVTSATSAEGNTTILVRDEHLRVTEVQDKTGMVISSSSSVLSRQFTDGRFLGTRPNAVFSATYPSFNAIRNGGGEYGGIDNPAPWNASGASTIARSKGKGYSGLYALVYDHKIGEELSQTITNPGFLKEGKKYIVRFWLKKNEYAPISIQITVSLDKPGSAYSEQVTLPIPDDGWNVYEAEFDTEGNTDWDNQDLASVVSISSSFHMEYLVDEVYLGELEHSGESRPGYAVTFTNALGQPIQSQAWDGADYTVSHSEYDDAGRPWKSWRSYSYDTEGRYDNNAAAHAASFYPGQVAYSKKEYFGDPLSRLRYIYPDGSNTTARIEYTYGSASINGINFPYSEVKDLGGVYARTFNDYQGRAIRTIGARGTPDEIISEAVVDPVHKTIKSRPPNYFDPPGSSTASDWVTTSTSDVLGLTITTTTPDAGTAKVINDEQGRLRFSQSAQQAMDNQVSFTSYDNLGRPMVSGEAFEDNFAGLDGETTEPMESDDLNAISVTAYDDKPSSATFPWSLFSSQAGSVSLENTVQAVAAEAYKTNGKSAAVLNLNNTTISGNGGTVSSPGIITIGPNYTIQPGGTQIVESGSHIVLKQGFHARTGSSFSGRIIPGLSGGNANNEEWQAIYYSYDFEGRLARKWILTQGKPELRTELSYTYNDAGQLIRQHTAIGPGQQLYHFYSYDALGRMAEVYVNTTPTRPATPVARYTYDAEGKLSMKETPQSAYGGNGYFYDEQGRLEQISSPYDVFTEHISYNPDGTINYIGISNDIQYTTNYSYDNLKRLTEANVTTGSTKYDVTNITYDKNGNIQSLNRYGNPGILDQLTYNYQTGTNRLESLDDAVATTAEDWDAEDATYSYNMDGSLISGTRSGGGGLERLSYGTNNLPINILTDNNADQVYRYNSSGWRISKEYIERLTGDAYKEYYIMDGAMNLAVTDEAGTVKYWNLFGNELIGRKEANGDHRYYTYDHLGSVRFVYDDNYSIIAKYDYYPFGLVMSSEVNESTKEGFTGKERDSETGLHYFGARYYDAALGRWSVTDPAGQLHTPYGYAGNPVSYVDPNGEFIVIAAAIMIGASLGSMQAGMRGEDPYRGMLKGGLIGGASAATGGLIGGSGFIAGAASGASSGVISGGIETAFSGGNLGQNVLAGVASGLVSGGISGYGAKIGADGILPGAAIGGLSGGLAGGVTSELSGGTFGDGFRLGGIIGATTGAIQGGIAAAESPYEKNILFGTYTRAGKRAYINDLAMSLSAYQNGLNQIEYYTGDTSPSGSKAYGTTRAVVNGKEVNLEPGLLNGAGTRSNVYLKINRPLKGIESTFRHEMVHVSDIFSGRATNFYNSQAKLAVTNTRIWAEIRAYRVSLQFGYRKFYYQQRLDYYLDRWKKVNGTSFPY